MGLLAVGLISLHWLLAALLQRGLRLPAPLRGLHQLLDRLGGTFDPDARADRRRQARVERARQQRDAIARASGPVPLDPPVEWDGNVARPQFGRKSPQRSHNLH